MEWEWNPEAEWTEFLVACRREGVAEKELRWYVVRIERYLKAHPRRAPQLHESADVQAYLECAAREAEIPGWLFWQLVHALQLFFREVIRAEWSASFDWRYWLESARGLEAGHSTLARHNRPVSSTVLLPSSPDEPFSLERLASQVAARIRLRNYSIRTEEAYVSWVRRFVVFHDERDPGVTRLPRTCSNPVTTSERCRISWGTRKYQPR